MMSKVEVAAGLARDVSGRIRELDVAKVAIVLYSCLMTVGTRTHGLSLFRRDSIWH